MNDDKYPHLHRGVKILHDPIRNKGTAFTEADRKALNLTGLLPPRVHTPAEQELRVLGNVRDKPTDLAPLPVPDLATGPQRDTFLSRGDEQHRRNDAADLYTDRRSSMPGISAYLPQTQGFLCFLA